MKKKCKVVMLPTEEATWPNCIWLGRISRQLRLDKSYNHEPKSIEPIDNSMLPQHLYILSDEKIKVGDCYLDECNTPRRCFIDDSRYWAVRESYKKIIATSNKSLNLPDPSPEFIEEFIREYNKGNVIKEVMVEYDAYNRSTTWEYDEPEIIELKVDKNNYITITREKDSWSREEVIEFVYKVLKAAGKEIKAEMVDISTHPHIIFTGVDEWIEENL